MCMLQSIIVQAPIYRCVTEEETPHKEQNEDQKTLTKVIKPANTKAKRKSIPSKKTPLTPPYLKFEH